MRNWGTNIMIEKIGILVSEELEEDWRLSCFQPALVSVPGLDLIPT